MANKGILRKKPCQTHPKTQPPKNPGEQQNPQQRRHERHLDQLDLMLEAYEAKSSEFDVCGSSRKDLENHVLNQDDIIVAQQKELATIRATMILKDRDIENTNKEWEFMYGRYQFVLELEADCKNKEQELRKTHEIVRNWQNRTFRSERHCHNISTVLSKLERQKERAQEFFQKCADQHQKKEDQLQKKEDQLKNVLQRCSELRSQVRQMQREKKNLHEYLNQRHEKAVEVKQKTTREYNVSLAEELTTRITCSTSSGKSPSPPVSPESEDMIEIPQVEWEMPEFCYPSVDKLPITSHSCPHPPRSIQNPKDMLKRNLSQTIDTETLARSPYRLSPSTPSNQEPHIPYRCPAFPSSSPIPEENVTNNVKENDQIRPLVPGPPSIPSGMRVTHIPPLPSLNITNKTVVHRSNPPSGAKPEKRRASRKTRSVTK